MKKARRFLVVCGETERLFLLSGVLHRVFPNAMVQTCRDREPALEAARSQEFDAVVAARPSDGDALTLVRELVTANRTPVIAVTDQREEPDIMAAGAVRFLDRDEWLMIGKAVADQIGATAP